MRKLMGTPRRRGGLSLVLAVILGVIAFNWGGIEARSTSTTTSTTTTAPSTTSTTEAEGPCPGTWEIAEADNGNNRWFAEGIEQVRQAETEEEAREAAKTWLDQVKRDPELLVGAASYFLDRQVEASTLVDGDCASANAKQLVAELELSLAEAEVTPEEAPRDGYNSGVNADGEVVVARHSGITGDRSAVKVVLKNGETLWLMARCGNPVVKKPPDVPEGPTDQPPPTTTTTQPPPPPTAPPQTVPKCADGTPEPCGTPDDGPEQQEVQDNDSKQVESTEEYDSGSAEETSQNQQEAEQDGEDEPSSDGESASDSDGTSGGTETPDGDEEEGGTDGASDPESSEGDGTENEEETDNPF